MSRLSRAHIHEDYTPSVGYPGLSFYDTGPGDDAGGGGYSGGGNDFSGSDRDSRDFSNPNGSGSGGSGRTQGPGDEAGGNDPGGTGPGTGGSGTTGDSTADTGPSAFDTALEEFTGDIDSVNAILQQLYGDITGSVAPTDLGIDNNTKGDLVAIAGRLQALQTQSGQQMNQNVADVNALMAPTAQRFDQSYNKTSGIAQMLESIGRGGIDPRFQQLANIQRDALRSAQQEQQTRQGNFFARRGLGNSSASLNAQNRMGTQFGQQEQMLQAQLGLQGLQRSDQALAQSAGLYNQAAGIAGQGASLQSGLLGQRAGFQQTDIGNQANVAAGLTALQGQQYGQNLSSAEFANAAIEQQGNLQTTTLQNSAAPIALMIAQLAAENGGIISGGGGGGGGGIFNK